jgi:alcohol dehydrogenase
MSTRTFFMPSVNLMGVDCLQEAIAVIGSYGLRHALLVTDAGLVAAGIAPQVVRDLEAAGIQCTQFSNVNPNPTTANVEAGLVALRGAGCDFVISLGGGSPHDCAKGIALTAANGGRIADYEGVDKSARPQLPLVAINTTAGTASEMTRFCIITDTTRHIKMAIVDKHTTPILSVNDPRMMAGMPPALTAATGMDALTHAIEAYVSTAATPITDACALQAARLIAVNLRKAVHQGHDMAAREQMAYAQFLAGMAFNNASLGYVHAMAHQLGGVYDLPHGVCNAVLLPHVQVFNTPSCAARLGDMARALGQDTAHMTDEQAAHACLAAIRALSHDVNIPVNLTALGVKAADIPQLAASALKDACGLTNPRKASQSEMEEIFRTAM